MRVYKERLRKNILEAVPFYPLGLSDVTHPNVPIALGLKSREQNVLAVWRIDGSAIAKIPWRYGDARLLYPTDLGIKVAATEGTLQNDFPRTRMACLLSA